MEIGVAKQKYFGKCVICFVVAMSNGVQVLT